VGVGERCALGPELPKQLSFEIKMKGLYRVWILRDHVLQNCIYFWKILNIF